MIVKLSPEEWSKMSETAHLLAFGKTKAAESDRISYALLIVHNDRPHAYITVRETDDETVYWQFGGMFPGFRGTTLTWALYKEAIDWTRKYHKKISTIIENTNHSMLRLAMKAGFRIMGLHYYNGDVLLQHLLEFEQGGI